MEAPIPDDGDAVTIHAWIQMGRERRETCIQIPAEEFKAGQEWVAADETRLIECWLERYVFDWLYVQYGWGWSGVGFYNDFSCMEGSDSGAYDALAVTSDSSIPNTRFTTVSGD